MNRGFAFILALAALAGCKPAATEGGQLPAPPALTQETLTAAAAGISPSDMRRRMGVMAHDSMRGRDTPSPELEEVAAYIASELRRFGVRPGAGDGYIQRYPYPLQALDTAGIGLEVRADGGADVLGYVGEFIVDPGGGAAGEYGMTFVGRRVDMAPLAAKGRVLVVSLPGTYTRNWRIARTAALRAAAEAGAEAVVFILDPSWTPAHLAALNRGVAVPRRVLGAPPAAFYITRDAGLKLIRRAGLSPSLLDRDVEAAVPMPGVTAAVNAPVRVIERAAAPNVVGVLPGSDPELRDTYVVLSAHMDHDGVGEPVNGDSIWNGADDNSSGTSAVMEVAEALASLPARPRRSVLFLLVSGEEKGLLGSRYFVEHPTVPLESIVANVNADMISRNAPDTIVAIGQDFSSLGPLTLAIAAEHPEIGLTVIRDPWPEQQLFFRSDHFNFVREEIPAIFFFNGIHEDYHRPSDELAKADTDKAARVGKLIFWLTHAIAEDPDPPEWTRDGLATIRRLTR